MESLQNGLRKTQNDLNKEIGFGYLLERFKDLDSVCLCPHNSKSSEWIDLKFSQNTAIQK